MAEFLTTAATIAAFERLVGDAKKEIILISPYLRLSAQVLSRIRDAAERGVPVTVMYGKQELSGEERQKLIGIPRLQVRFLERLHAKCYLSENRAIVSSLNLYEYSEQWNREMSVLLTRETDRQAYLDLADEVLSMLREAAAEHLSNHRGFCISCGVPKDYDCFRPHCSSCFAGWQTETVPAAPHCHGCGKSARTSREWPLCRECYAKDPFDESPFG